MTLESTDRTVELEQKLDQMSAQLDLVVAELREQRLRREQWQELMSDLGPITTEAMGIASRELEAVQDWVEPADMLRLLRRIVRNTNNIEEGMAKYESAMEFVSDLGPLTAEAFMKALNTLEDYESRGYFEFIGSGLGVVDRIVTGYSKEEVEALGDNVVDMLDIIKDLTQPEMLAVADRLLDVVARQQRVEALEIQDPPTLFGLIKLMRDPEIRRGIGRALRTFKAVTAGEVDEVIDLEPAPTDEETNNTPGGA
ncbi:MAG: DUF1641 domain-containing protein [Actinomycetota bacterium]